MWRIEEMTKSVRQCYWLWLAGFSIGGLVFGVLMIEWSPVFLLPLLVVQVSAGIGLMSLQCNKCEASLLYRDQYVFGIRVRAFWPTLPRKCPVCTELI